MIHGPVQVHWWGVGGVFRLEKANFVAVATVHFSTKASLENKINFWHHLMTTSSTSIFVFFFTPSDKDGLLPNFHGWFSIKEPLELRLDQNWFGSEIPAYFDRTFKRFSFSGLFGYNLLLLLQYTLFVSCPSWLTPLFSQALSLLVRSGRTSLPWRYTTLLCFVLTAEHNSLGVLECPGGNACLLIHLFQDYVGLKRVWR